MSSVQNLTTLRNRDFAFGETNLCELAGRTYIPNQCVLLLCKRGRAVVMANSDKQVVREGDLVVLFSDVLFSPVALSTEFCADFLHFSPKIMEKIYYEITSESFWIIMSEHHVLRPSTAQYNLLQGWFRQMEWMMAHCRDDRRTAIIQDTLFNFFLILEGELLRHFPVNRQSYGKDRAWMLFGKFMSLLITHCHEVREVAFYAKELCITTDYLYKICNKIEHKTPKAIIDNVVTGEIKQYLSDTDLSIKEIAQEFKFEEASYLAHFFRRMTGLSPLDYRGRQGRLY